MYEQFRKPSPKYHICAEIPIANIISVTSNGVILSPFAGYLESRRGTREGSSGDKGFDRRVQSGFEQGAVG